jgi:hypothetical protein
MIRPTRIKISKRLMMILETEEIDGIVKIDRMDGINLIIGIIEMMESTMIFTKIRILHKFKKEVISSLPCGISHPLVE